MPHFESALKRFLRRRRSVGLCLLVAILGVTGTFVTWTLGKGAADAAQQPDLSGSVTLPTGDRVRVDGAGRPTEGVVRASGRSGVQFLRQRSGSDEYVIPSDAVPALAKGVLDREVFNVGRLAAQARRPGAGNESKVHAKVSLILRYADGVPMRSAGASERTVSDVARMTAVSVGSENAATLWTQVKDGLSTGRLRKVWLDAYRRRAVDHGVEQIGAPTAWQSGYTGKGVKVAVLDSGYDDTHPDLAGVVVGSKSFVDRWDVAYDPSGHGTHVASTIAGSGAASNGNYKGVAPDAKLLIGRVCVEERKIGEDECPTSAIMDGMSWAVEQGAKVVNLSLGDYGTAEKTADEELADELTARSGTLFVAATGNGGSAPGCPACADSALAVGSADPAGRLSPGSTRGPRVRDGAIKPDVLAPGEQVTAARSSDMQSKGGGPSGPYMTLGGTSMASPHAAGAAALIAQAHPNWKAPAIKGALMATATRVGTPFESGSGLIDVAKAVKQSLYAEPASVSFGRIAWPQPADDTHTQKVTLHNTGPTELTLKLSLADPVPGQLFSVPATVVVPAGGGATVPVTAIAKASAATGLYSATLVAQTADGGVRARIPVGLVREPESVEHTFSVLDRNGKPSRGMVAVEPVPNDGNREEIPLTFDGAAQKLRLPRGRWTFVASFRSDADDPNSPTVVAALPDVDSGEHRSIEFDARSAVTLRMTAPDPQARVVSVSANAIVAHDNDHFLSLSADGGAGTGVTEATAYVIPTAAGQQAREFEFSATAVFARPNGDDFDGSTEVYRAYLGHKGSIPTDLTYRPAAGEFATVTSHYGRAGKDGAFSEGFRSNGPLGLESSGSAPLRLPAAGTRTTHFASTGETPQWSGELNNESYFAWQAQQPRTYAAGQRYDLQWNRPMHTLALPDGFWRSSPPLRRGRDTIFVDHLPMYSGGTDGQYGNLPSTQASVELYENGTKIAEDDSLFWATLHTGFRPADYRLVARTVLATPDVPGAASTVEWTFRSSSELDGARALPVSVARLAPSLDEGGRAPAGAAFDLPIQIQGAPGDVTSLTVDVSYDAGVTWNPATVQRTDKGWYASYAHPAQVGAAVSLRTHLVRADGGTTTFTQANAYQLK